MTKDPIIKSVVRNVIKEELIPVDNHFRKIEENIARIENHLDSFEQKLLAQFAEFRSEMHTLIDPLFKELKKFNEEQSIQLGSTRKSTKKSRS